jgi:hypothetical protein
MSQTHWKKAFNKDYLGSHDLEPGQDLIAVIKSVGVIQVVDPKGDKSPCNVAHFAGNIKPMILNSTACKQMRGWTGSPYIEDWIKVPVQIFILDGVRAFGEVVEALRLRPMQPRTEKPVLTVNHDRWEQAKAAYNSADDKAAKLEFMRGNWVIDDTTAAALDA